jgi:hypothetical protein
MMAKPKKKYTVSKTRSLPAFGLAVRTGSHAGVHKNKGLRSVGPQRKRKHKGRDIE